MEELEFDQRINGNYYQIVIRHTPPDPITLWQRQGSPQRTTHYLLNGIELSEREWDKQLMADKLAEAPQES